MELFPLALVLVGVVLLAASLLSGFVERTGVPQVAVFLALGAAIGPHGLNIANIGLDSPFLQVTGTLSLALVLFTDALTLKLSEVRRHLKLAAIILLPGTLIAAAIIASGAHYMIGLAWPLALILGAALASTDPVLLRAVLKWPSLPMNARLALRLESGLNDIVLLPVILVAMTFAVVSGAGHGGSSPLESFLRVALLGPLIGTAVGWIAVRAMASIRSRIGIRRDYESLYSLGVAFMAFGAGETAHASGFIAAFFAGIVISALDIELCDCFVEYGETTAELAMLLTFVLLGMSLVWEAFGMASPMVWGVVALALVARPFALKVALRWQPMSKRSKGLLLWFGPRGLSSILLVLVPVFAHVPGSEQLFKITCLAMLVSVVIHGGSVMALTRKDNGNHESELPSVLITIDEIKGKKLDGERPIVLDVRSDKSYAESNQRIPGGIRIDPARAAFDVRERMISEDNFIIAYCTCPNDKTSIRVAQELRNAGFANAYAVQGGMTALEEYAVPKTPEPV